MVNHSVYSRKDRVGGILCEIQNIQSVRPAHHFQITVRTPSWRKTGGGYSVYEFQLKGGSWTRVKIARGVVY